MSKLPFKVVAVDMDGTFMRNDQTFDHQRFNRILNQLRADGAHFIVSSGRPYTRLREDFAGFLTRIDMIADNGSLLLKDNEIISSHLLTYQTTVDLIKFVQKHYPESSVIVTGVYHSYTTIDASPDFKKKMSFYYPESIEVNDLLAAVTPDDQITKITLSYRKDFSAELTDATKNLKKNLTNTTLKKFTVLQVVSACLILCHTALIKVVLYNTSYATLTLSLAN